jgi:hypothetical protein
VLSPFYPGVRYLRAKRTYWRGRAGFPSAKAGRQRFIFRDGHVQQTLGVSASARSEARLLKDLYVFRNGLGLLFS